MVELAKMLELTHLQNEFWTSKHGTEYIMTTHGFQLNTEINRNAFAGRLLK
jgi:hypothetical protein